MPVRVLGCSQVKMSRPKWPGGEGGEGVKGAGEGVRVSVPP